MKLNQFAVYEVPFETKISDFLHIGLLPNDYRELSNTQLFNLFLEGVFPEQQTKMTKLEAMHHLLCSERQDLGDFYLAKDKTLSDVEFYNVALQLLGFEVGLDFQLDHGFEYLQQLGLPVLKATPLIARADTIIAAFYYLFNLRTKKGQIYLDDLANRGFFNPFFDSPTPQFVLFNGRAQAVFDARETIREVVYVKSDLDTDQDGRSDLLETTIFRPKATELGLKVPSLYTANPYFKGTNDMQASLHDVNVPLAAKPSGRQLAESPALLTELDTPQPTENQVTASTESAEIQSAADNIYSLNDYFLARGMATVYAGGIGTRHSDGVRTCGSPAETESTIAIIQWLHGDRVAYTNKTNKIAIQAWWCNGNVAMTGKSYLGTLAIAAATTGVAGLKTIIAESAISSWYDYYRDNGLVVAPEACQGEDTDVLAIDTFSRLKDAGDMPRVRPIYEATLAALKAGQDRDSGNYNAFWADRNYRTKADQIKCPVLIVHGLNDWNVKLRNPEKLWRALRENDLPAKIFLHQGQHVYMNNIRSIDYNDMANLWLTNKLLDYPNHSDSILPRVLIQDNALPETWHHYQDWCSETTPEKTVYFGESTLLLKPAITDNLQHFTDNGTATFLAGDQNEAKWQRAIISAHSDYDDTRLRFLLAPQKDDWYIDGNLTLTLQIASSVDHGLLSAMVVDYGRAKRLRPQPSILERDGLKLGFDWVTEDLKEFQLGLATPFKMITKGHINLQNRTDPATVFPVQPNSFYTVHFQLQPTHYHLLAGHQLGVVLYATDMGMTLRTPEVITYQVDLNACQLAVPLLR